MLFLQQSSVFGLFFFCSAFIGNTSWMRHISEEMWGELSVTEKYTLLTFKKWHSGSLLVLGKNKHWESFQKQLEEVTTIIICLWRSHCNIQLSVNGRDRLLSRSISHYLTVASWGKKKKAIYKQWRLTICTGLIKHIFLIIKEKKKKDINRFFPSIMYTEQRGGVGKWLSTSLCKFTHRKTASKYSL